MKKQYLNEISNVMIDNFVYSNTTNYVAQIFRTCIFPKKGFAKVAQILRKQKEISI